MAETLVGVYDELRAVLDAVEALHNTGFYRERMRVIAASVWGEMRTDATDNFATQLMPGGKWATLQALPTILSTLEVPETEISMYAEAVRRGGIVLVVRAADEQLPHAMEIMQRFQPLDIDQWAEQWRATGWTSFQPASTPYTADLIAEERERFRVGSFQEGTAAVPVVEEELVVGKRQVAQGGVRVRSFVTEHPVAQTVQLRSEHVTVERRPVDRPISPAVLEAFPQGTVEIRATAEEAVVTKQAHVVEEVVVRKDVAEHTETVRDTVRRTDVAVEPVEDQRAVGRPATQSLDADMRLRPEQSFYFHGPAHTLNLQAASLRDFSRLSSQVDDATWLYHLRRGDYTRWFRTTIQDEGLATASERLEQAELTPAEGRARLRSAIEERYADVTSVGNV